MKSDFSAPYQHQLRNHLLFDKVRSLQFEVDLLRSYLQSYEDDPAAANGFSSEIDALFKVSVLLFDDVYKSLLDKLS